MTHPIFLEIYSVFQSIWNSFREFFLPYLDISLFDWMRFMFAVSFLGMIVSFFVARKSSRGYGCGSGGNKRISPERRHDKK